MKLPPKLVKKMNIAKFLDFFFLISSIVQAIEVVGVPDLFCMLYDSSNA